MKEVKTAYITKMKNKLFGLLCEREKGRDWETFLNSILIELMGQPDEERSINYYILYYKLSSCRFLSYDYFRSTIFDCMTLLGKDD